MIINNPASAIRKAEAGLLFSDAGCTFSLYDLGASLSVFPVPGDVLPEAELPLEAVELPEGAALEAVALEVVVPGVVALEAVVLPVLVLAVVAEAGRAALAVALPAATLAVATCG